VFDQIARKNHSRTGHMEVVIDQVILIEDDCVLAKQLEEVLRIVAAVTDPAAAEDLPPIQVSTRRRTFSCPLGDSFENALPQFGGERLVCIESQDPGRFDGQGGERPLPLLRVTFKWMRHYVSTELSRDVRCAIGAAGVDDEQLFSPVSHACEARLEVALLVESEHHDCHRHLSALIHHVDRPLSVIGCRNSAIRRSGICGPRGTTSYRDFRETTSDSVSTGRSSAGLISTTAASARPSNNTRRASLMLNSQSLVG